MLFCQEEEKTKKEVLGKMRETTLTGEVEALAEGESPRLRPFCKQPPFQSVHGRLQVNIPFAASAVTGTISQLHTSSGRKLSLSATRQPFTGEIALLYVFSLSNSFFSVCFLCLYDLSHTQEQAVAPCPSHNRDGSEKVRTFDKRTHRHKPFDLQRLVSVLWLRHAQLRDLVKV